MVFLVFDDVLEDGDGAFVAQDLELLAVAGDGAALLDLEAAESHADAAGTAGQRVGIASGLSVIDGRRSTELGNAIGPESGVFQLCGCEVAENLGADRFGVAVGQGLVRVIALHLGLPVAFQGSQNLFHAGIGQDSDGQVSLLAFS